MNRRKITLATLAIVAAVSIACEGEEGVGTGPGHDPQPNKANTATAVNPTNESARKSECATMVDPAVPPNLGQKRYITVWTCLETAYGPYTVTYHASDAAGNTLASTEEHVVDAAKPFNRIIGYDTGQKITLSIQIRPARPGSKLGYIIAKDGPANVKKGRIDGGFTIRIEINSAR